MSYWVCPKCGAYVQSGEYRVCQYGTTAQTATYQPNYLTILERIEQSLLRIEKLLEKEL